MSLQGEIKLSVTIEDEANKDLPSAVQLFRPIRQYVYGVLFSLAETRKKAERLAMRKNCLSDCEWCGQKSPLRHCKCRNICPNQKIRYKILIISELLQLSLMLISG